MYEVRYWGTLLAYTVLDIAGWVHTSSAGLMLPCLGTATDLLDIPRQPMSDKVPQYLASYT